MLSFDVSDKQVKVIKGSNSNGRIKVDASLTIDIPEGFVQNGNPIQFMELGGLIKKELDKNHINEKEAVVTFSSTDIIFKELEVPKGKNDEILSMVTTHMKNEMNISDEYLISYSIVGSSNSQTIKVLATACLAAIVENYKKAFKYAGPSLKSVSMNCNAISHLVRADAKNLEKTMPLLVIQVNNDFLGMTLFENCQMSYARSVDIYPEESNGDPEQYIVEKLVEQVFMMNQFNLNRSNQKINTVLLYGDINTGADYRKMLVDALADEGITVDVSNLAAPLSVDTGNAEYTEFANAIGALYKRDKNTERLNLLEIDANSRNGGQASKEAVNGMLVTAGIITLASIVAIGAICLVMSMKANQIGKRIDEKQASIDQCNEVLEANKIFKNQKLKIEDYNAKVQLARTSFESLPVMKEDLLDTIDDALKQAVNEKVSYTGYSYDVKGTVTLSNVIVSGSDVKTQDRPREVVNKLKELNIFEDVTYNGYVGGGFVDTDVTISTLTLNLKNPNDVAKDEETNSDNNNSEVAE